MNVNPMTPITTVKVLHNIPLDNTYKDTLTFANVSAQVAYFNSKVKYTFSNMTPIRMQNQIRIPTTADNLFDCNYIMFQNANFNSKWFFAFITKIEFENVNMCNVTFEIDVMQTWWWDTSVMECFVEREHVSDDTIGRNLVPENLELGEYIMGPVFGSKLNNVKEIVACTTEDGKGGDVQGDMVHGLYQGCAYIHYNASQSGVDNMNTYLKNLTNLNKQDAIVSMFMCWESMLHDGTLTDNAPARPNDLDGYTPRNNKLLTSPYVQLVSFDGVGGSNVYQYEYFQSAQPQFEISWDVTPNPSVYVTPIGYYKGRETQRYCITGFPQCAWTIDTYRAWLAQNGGVEGVAADFGYNLLGNLLGAGALGLTGNAFMASAGLNHTFKDTFDAFKQVSVQQSLPPSYRGVNSGSAAMANNQLYPHYVAQYIRAEFARKIDGYFDRFGYAVNELKIPNLTGRPSWNYVKTRSACVIGSVPFDDVSKIRSILDNGITFWHGDYVGDYSRANK